MAIDKLVAEALLRNANLINLVLAATADQARLISDCLTKCDADDGKCRSLATVKHDRDPFKYCDHHAAQIIVRASRGTGNTDLQHVESWQELNNVKQIRRLQEYIKELDRIDASAPELH